MVGTKAEGVTPFPLSITSSLLAERRVETRTTRRAMQINACVECLRDDNARALPRRFVRAASRRPSARDREMGTPPPPPPAGAPAPGGGGPPPPPGVWHTRARAVAFSGSRWCVRVARRACARARVRALGRAAHQISHERGRRAAAARMAQQADGPCGGQDEGQGAVRRGRRHRPARLRRGRWGVVASTRRRGRVVDTPSLSRRRRAVAVASSSRRRRAVAVASSTRRPCRIVVRARRLVVVRVRRRPRSESESETLWRFSCYVCHTYFKSGRGNVNICLQHRVSFVGEHMPMQISLTAS